jgi:predicted double-glycine peptidase
MKNPIYRYLVGLFALTMLIPGISTASERVVRSLLEMRHDKVIMQEWDLSCGAAALTTLLRYQHGDPVTEKEVATALINRDIYIKNPQLVRLRQGFSLLDLKRYVDSRGYRGVGLGKMTLEDLVRRAPVLIPINVQGYNHFVIFRGQMGNRVLLADPAWGNRTMTVDRFQKAWIDYVNIGHVGFVVEGKDNVAGQTAGLLLPQPKDFPTLH